MYLSIRQVHVKIERTVQVPRRRNPSRAAPGLQCPRIAGAGRPRVVQLVLYGEGRVAGNALRIIGHGIPVRPVHPVPVALRGRVRAHEVGHCGYDCRQIHCGVARGGSIRARRCHRHLRWRDRPGRRIQTATRDASRSRIRRVYRRDGPRHAWLRGTNDCRGELLLFSCRQGNALWTHGDALCTPAEKDTADVGAAPTDPGHVDLHVTR